MPQPNLKDFFVLAESTHTHYTLEPESNGNGRLLAWEERTYAAPGQVGAEEDQSYEVLAHGGFDRLADALVAQLGEDMLAPGTGDFAQLRRLWDEAVESGEAVVVEPALDDGSALAMGVFPKGKKESEGSYGFEDL